jgi:hypothetical protein
LAQKIRLVIYNQTVHFFLERTAKVLPLFILDDEKEKKTGVGSVFLVETRPKNHTTEKSTPLIPYSLVLQPDH